MRLDMIVALGAALLASMTIVLSCGGFDLLAGRPIRFKGDSVFHYTLAKAVLDDGWTWHAHRLGAPSGCDFLSFGLNLPLESAFLWLFSFTTDDCVALLNRVWILLCGLSAAGGYAAFRLVGLSRTASFVCGCLFATIPYVYYRSVGHFNLHVAFVPIPTAAAVLVLSDGLRGLTRRAWYGVLGSCFLVGLGFVYYSFFTFVLLVAAIGIAWLTDHRGSIRRGAACVIVIGCGTVINLAPVAIDWAWHGKPSELNDRLPEHADMFALRIRDMITPSSVTPIPGLRSLGEAVERVPWPSGEGTFSKLGTVGAIGFVICLGVLAGIRPPGDPRNAPVVRAAATCALVLVVIGVTGGFGSLFNVFVMPTIRCYNRVLPLLAILSLLPVGCLLDACMTSCGRGIVAAAIPATVLGFGLIEQNTAHKIRHEAASHRETRADLEVFITLIERDAREHAAVYMIPATAFPNDAPDVTMKPYDHAKAFLFSRHLRWSWPIFGPGQRALVESLGPVSGSEFIGRLRDAGFDYVWVDRNAAMATDHEAVVVRGGGRLLHADRTGRYAFYDLSGVSHAD